MSTDTSPTSAAGPARRAPARDLLHDRRRTVPVVLTALAIAIGSFLVVVLSPDAATSGGAPSPSPAPAAGVTRDAIEDYVYRPATLVVPVGSKVTWTNRDDVPHSATAAGRFDTGLFGKGQSRTITFHRAGTFAYICSIHPFMHGKVVVR